MELVRSVARAFPSQNNKESTQHDDHGVFVHLTSDTVSRSQPQEQARPDRNPTSPPTPAQTVSPPANENSTSEFTSTSSAPPSLTPLSSNALVNRVLERPEIPGFQDMPVPENLKSRFRDFRLLYSSAFLKAMSRKDRPLDGIGMTPMYLGNTQVDAQLYVVVECEKQLAKRVKKFFSQKKIREFLGPDFKVRIITTGLPLLGVTALPAGLLPLAGSGPRIEIYRDSSIQSNTLCGTSIQMRCDTLASPAFATLGGLLEVFKEGKTTIYGLTAGHSLRKVHAAHDESTISTEGGDSEEDWDDDSDYDLAEDDDFVQILDVPSTPGMELPNDADDGQNAWNQQQSLLGTISDCTSLTPPTPQAGNGNRDWALALIPADQCLPNRIGARDVWMGVTEMDLSSPQQVSALTGRGPRRGKLTCNRSTVLIPPGDAFVETLDFLPIAGDGLQEGDSGSWVILETTGEVLGYVVAGGIFGKTCIMPIHETVRDIQSYLQADRVGLAMWATIQSLRRKERLPGPGGEDPTYPEATLTGSESNWSGDTIIPSHAEGPAGPIRRPIPIWPDGTGRAAESVASHSVSTSTKRPRYPSPDENPDEGPDDLNDEDPDEDGGGAITEPQMTFNRKKPKTVKHYPCPFRMRDPIRFNLRDYEYCWKSPFRSITELKKHLIKYHVEHTISFRCVRCNKRFDRVEDRERHMRQEPRCSSVRDMSHPNEDQGGYEITPEVVDKLRSRAEHFDWTRLWYTLFPRDKPQDIPSPVFEPPVELTEFESEYQSTRPELRDRLSRALETLLSQTGSMSQVSATTPTDMSEALENVVEEFLGDLSQKLRAVAVPSQHRDTERTAYLYIKRVDCFDQIIQCNSKSYLAILIKEQCH
ncbi:hypothetical protein QBC34DRAFT_433766 [Podospora aff. communis PSN243]|uniref:C2H2-type domain-containing protein n=1 Tax=Podospora aff. communis PSN243 TaxID=3040156 RepID=A0AAV9H3F2_9PEZI|nr:hypothetical protein QBC34DRAFT_433766 [Podospora aff. communis PSN243]